MAESGGQPRAYNPRGADKSYGLWQINMLGGMGPERRAQFGLSSNDELFDPKTNAKAAYQIYKQQGINAWGAYTNGSYKQFLKRGGQVQQRQSGGLVQMSRAWQHHADIHDEQWYPTRGRLCLTFHYCSAGRWWRYAYG